MARGARIAALLIAAALVAACGGGGSGGSGGGTSITVAPASVSFTGVEGAAPPAPVTVKVTFSGDGVVVGYAPGVTPASWLQVTQQGVSGNTVDFQLAVTPGLVGTVSTSLRFATGTVSGTNVRTFDLPVAYTVTPSDLAISVAPASLRFAAVSGGPAPPPQSVLVTFNGTQVQVAGAPPWLSVSLPATAGTSPASVLVAPLQVNTAGGTLSGNVVLATTRPGSSLQRLVTLPVEYVITEPFSASAPALSFSKVHRSSAAPQPAGGYAVTVRGSNAAWRATADQSWLRLAPSSGAGAGTVTVSADASSFAAAGLYAGTVTITDDASGQARTFDASFDNRAAGLTVAPGALTFDIDRTTSAAALTKSLTLSDELGGTIASEAVTWSVQSIDEPWLRVAPPSGTSVPAAQAAVSLEPAELAKLAPGNYQATITLRYSNAQVAGQTLTVPVQLSTRLPLVNYVAPYVGLAGAGGTLIVRGQGFDNTGAALSVAVGATVFDVQPDTETQLTLQYPALPAGRYPVNIRNAAGISGARPELVVIAPPAMTADSIDAPGPRRRLVWDAERSTLYAANTLNSTIERFRFAGGVWTTLAPYSLDELSDIDLAPDGRSLIALARNAVHEVELGAAQFAAVSRAANPDPFCGGHFDRLAAANHGKMFIVFNFAGCSGFTPSYLYDLRSFELAQNPGFQGFLYNGIAVGSADGSRVYSGSNGVSPAQPLKIYSALEDSIIDGTPTYNVAALSVSGNASRVIVQNRDVHDRGLSSTGSLPGDGVVLASRDSARAFVYRDDGGQPRIEVYGLGGTLPSGTQYPLLQTVNLADLPNGAPGEYASIALATSRDDKVLFVSGSQRVLVVPVE
jgi:hypothetical protein